MMKILNYLLRFSSTRTHDTKTIRTHSAYARGKNLHFPLPSSNSENDNFLLRSRTQIFILIRAHYVPVIVLGHETMARTDYVYALWPLVKIILL